MSGIIENSLADEIYNTLNGDGTISHICKDEFEIGIGEFELEAIKKYDGDAAEKLVKAGIVEIKITVEDFELIGEKSDELDSALGYNASNYDEFQYKHAAAKRTDRTMLNCYASNTKSRDAICARVIGHKIKSY